MHFSNLFKRIYLVAICLVGIGYIAILPVFEGFDETAHYSYLRQVADTGSIPIYGKSYLSQQVVTYGGPLPYGSLEPPFGNGPVYKKFFADSNLVENYLNTYRKPHATQEFEPSATLNWQAQHPPLYYILLAPLLQVLENTSLVDQFFIIRLTSFMLAISGIILGIFSMNNNDPPDSKNCSALGYFIYPMVLPMFFLEFTRIGNDSLCLFLTGLIAYLLPRWFQNEFNKPLSISLGISLGLGLLTKAFFIPISMAIACFLVLKIYLERKNSAVFKRLLNLLIIFIPTLIIGSLWYLYNLFFTGIPPSGNDAIQLANQGGLWANLKLNFSSLALIRGIIVTIATYSWGGTWSLTRLPSWFQLPLLITLAWVAMSFLAHLRKTPLRHPLWLPIWILVIFALGFLWHIFISIALNGNGNTPGWYLHILLPFLAPLFGIGTARILRNPLYRKIFISLLSYCLIFQIITIWSQITLFTGCSVKGNDKIYLFPNHLFCLNQTVDIWNRLDVLAWPSLAALTFMGGGFAYLWLLRNYPKRHSL